MKLTSHLCALLLFIATALPARAQVTNAELLKRIQALEADRIKDRAELKDAKAKIARMLADDKLGPAKKGSMGEALATPAATAGLGGQVKSVDDQRSTLEKLKDTPATLNQISDGFAVPDSPAAASLGLPQKDVQHIETPKQLVGAAINGVDEHGNFQTGISVDFAPMQYFWRNRKVADFRYGPERDTWGDAAIWFRRVLARTQISFASTKGVSEDDKSNKLALGLHVVLANGNDALSNALIRARPVGANDPEAEGRDEVVTAADGKLLDARGRRLNEWVIGWKDKHSHDRFFKTDGMMQSIGEFLYSQTSWTMGVAPHWIAAEGTDDYEHAGTTYWSSFAILPSPRIPARVLLNVLYQQGEDIPGKEAFEPPAPVAAGMMAAAVPATINQNSLYLVGGVQVGNTDFNATFTGAYIQYDQDNFGKREEYRWTAAVEKRISTNSWLTLGLSRSEGDDEGSGETMVLGGVKMGLGGRDFSSDGQKTRALQFAHE